MIELSFLDNWRLELYFYKLSHTFLFNHVVLYFKLTGKYWPGSVHNGAQSEIYDHTFINSTIQKAYECKNGLRIDLGEVTLTMKNIRIEPFFNKRPNIEFEDKVTCHQDDEQIEAENNNNYWLFFISLFFSS